MNTRDDRNRTPERLDRPSLERPGEPSREGTRLPAEPIEARPAVVEREVAVRKPAKTHVEQRVDHEANDALERRADRATENALHRAGDALAGAAPTVGRTAEGALGATGSALSAAGGVLGTVLGKIAGRLGGWWSTAKEAIDELPEEERQACLVHFEAYELRPAEMTFERALPGYSLGYVAARNPAYQGRPFEEIETDLRLGFTGDDALGYDAVRDFSRFGYERGASRFADRTAGDRASREATRTGEELSRATDDLQRAAGHAGDAARHAKEAAKAAASGVADRAQELARDAAQSAGRTADRVADSASEAAGKAGHVANRVAHAQPNRDLERRVDHATDTVLDAAGGALERAAPAVGRGLEATTRVTGTALNALAGPLGTAVGKIAKGVGGWWNTTTEVVTEFPPEEEQLCVRHFETYAEKPADLSFDTARTAYQIGYLAAANPGYRDRTFDDVEVEVRHGFAAEPNEHYRALRDFTRFGYERAMIIRPSQDEPRVELH
jgi:hypothetical protein